MKQATIYKREFSFLDAKRNKVEAEVEITTRNGYPEFTASGNYENGGGQVFDNIEPANDQQKEFIQLWKDYHLNGFLSTSKKKLPKDFEDTLNALIDSIEELEEERKGNPLNDLDDTSLIALIERETLFDGRDAELCAALVKMFSLCENDLQDIEIDDNRVKVQGTSYLAGTDEEMDQEWDEYLENYIDECLEIPESVERYFDREKWKDDAKMDGRGHSLNSYDGGEEEQKIKGTWYYAYRN